ncbi:uncharacterized protein TNCV_4050121 [Trichonephila clavipes]|nr:uncharacterized protein TNCV_4050121 [Trichonephila clavipes]
MLNNACRIGAPEMTDHEYGRWFSDPHVCRVRRLVRRKMVYWEYLWPTLRCSREAGVSPLLSMGWWYLSSASPKRHCCRVSAVPGLPDDRHTASLVGLRGGWMHARMKFFTRIYGSNAAVPGPTQPKTVKAGYLNCKIRPYIPNPLRCFKCQRFGQSQTSCRDQLTCSRCASAGHSSTDCTLEPKCINCLQSHASDSKLCPKWMLEKQIQKIKTNKNISYSEARKLMVPQPSQTYAQITKPTAISTQTTQTDPNITNIVCPPLHCLRPVSSENPMPGTSSSVSTVSTSSCTQKNLLPSPSAIMPTIQGESLLNVPIPITTTTTSPGNNLNTSVSSLETETRSLATPNEFAALSNETQPLVPLPESVPTASNGEHPNAPENPQCIKRNSRSRRKRPKVQKPEIEIKMAPHRPRKSAPIE